MKIERRWDSLSEFIDYAMGSSEMSDFMRASRSTGKSFTGTNDIEGALAIAFGWKDGAKRVESMRANLKIQGVRPRRMTVARENGPGVVSMGTFLAGHPQPYMVTQDSPDARHGKGKVVKVMLNVCVSGGIDKKILEARGAATLALCDALERAGRRTEIYVAMANTPNAHRLEYVIRVKAASQRFSLPSIAFAVAHPAMFRRFIFSAMERESSEARAAFRVPGGYGRVGEMENHDGFIYLGGATLGDGQWGSEVRSREWILKELEGQGITLT